MIPKHWHERSLIQIYKSFTRRNLHTQAEQLLAPSGGLVGRNQHPSLNRVSFYRGLIVKPRGGLPHKPPKEQCISKLTDNISQLSTPVHSLTSFLAWLLLGGNHLSQLPSISLRLQRVKQSQKVKESNIFQEPLLLEPYCIPDFPYRLFPVLAIMNKAALNVLSVIISISSEYVSKSAISVS